MIPNRKALVSIGLLVIAGTVQAATSINTCPFAITAPGDYLLAADLICGGGNGISILSSDVTLALEGHRITAGEGANYAISNFSSSGEITRVEHVRVLGPGLITNGGGNAFRIGVFFFHVDNSEVSGITVLGSMGSGIAATGDFLTITGNTLGRNGSGTIAGAIGLIGVHFSTISGNDVSGNNESGLDARDVVASGPLGTVSHNIFNGNTTNGLFVVAGDFTGATIQHNIAVGNGANGIGLGTADGPAEVTNNTSLANGNFDLADFTPNCTGHVWSGNKFFTANQSCIH